MDYGTFKCNLQICFYFCSISHMVTTFKISIKFSKILEKFKMFAIVFAAILYPITAITTTVTMWASIPIVYFKRRSAAAAARHLNDTMYEVDQPMSETNEWTSLLAKYVSSHTRIAIYDGMTVLSAWVTTLSTATTWSMVNDLPDAEGVQEAALISVATSCITTLMTTCRFLGLGWVSLEKEILDALRCRTALSHLAPPEQQVAESFEALAGFMTATIAAFAAAFSSRKKWHEIFGHVIQNWGKTASSTSSMFDSLKKIWAEFNPDSQALDAFNTLRASADRLTEIYGMSSEFFIESAVQDEIKQLVDKFETVLMKTVDTKNDAVKQVILRHNGTYSKILSRIEQLNAIIKYSSQVRRKPVFYNLMGPGGHGKSYMVEQIYADLNKRMVSSGFIKSPMRRMIGTGAADDYLPPMSDQEWYQIDEYLGSYDDKWISVINQTVSDNPATLSSAFVKFTVPKPHFVLTTSNVTLPFSPPVTSKNYMRAEVLDAWNSRHNFVEVRKADYDPNTSRDRQDRSTPLTLTLKIYKGKNKWEDQPITYPELLDKMMSDWDLFDKKFTFAKEQAKVMLADLERSMPQTSTPEAEAPVGNPKVMAFYGPPGAGKTFAFNNTVAPLLRLTYTMKKYVTVPDSPEPGITCHVFDDVLSVKKSFMRYKEFFDQCESSHMIVIIDNWMPRTITMVRHPRFWWDSRIYTAPLEWWTRCFTYSTVDLSDLPHESLGRRLGISVQHKYRGKWFTPACDKIEAFDFKAESITLYSDHQRVPRPISYLTETFLPTIMNAKGALRAARPGEVCEIPERWDLEVKLTHPSHVATAYAFPTDREHVRVIPQLSSSFPDYMSYFNFDSSVISGPMDLLPALSAAYRRQPYTATVEVQGMWLRISNGIFFSSDAVENQGSWTVRIKEDRMRIKIRGEWKTFTFADIHAHSLNLDGLTNQEIRQLAQECDVVRSLTSYRRYVDEFKVKAYVMSLQEKAMTAWKGAYDLTMKHKKLAFLIGGVAVVVTVGSGLMFLLKKKKKVTPRGAPSRAESYEQSVRMVQQVRGPIRNDIGPKPVAESYEQSVKTVQTVRSPLRSVVGQLQQQPITTAAPTSVPESLSGLELSQALSPEMTSVRSKLKDAMCVVGQESGMLYGIFIGGNKVLSPAHCICNPNQPLIVLNGGKSATYYNAKILFMDATRDLALSEIQDKTFPARPDLRKHFCREKDLKNVSESIHYLPVEDIMAPADAEFHTTLGEKRLNTDNTIPGWNPTRRIIITDFFTFAKVTKKGDCGSPVLCPTTRMEARNIVGIHIGATGVGHCRGLVATVTQEDLAQMYGETTTPEGGMEIPPMITLDLGNGPQLTSPLVAGLFPGENEDMEYRIHEIMDNERIVPVAFVPRLYAPSHKRGGKLRLSPLSPHLNPDILPNEKVPAPVSYKDPVLDPAKLVDLRRDFYGHPSIGATQLAKIEGPLVDISLEQENRIVNNYVSMMKNWPGIRDWRLLTNDEVLNGWDHPKYSGLLGPVKTDTSAGFPFKQLFNVSSKGQMLERGIDGRLIFSDNDAGKYLQTSIARLMDDAKDSGTPHLHIIEAHLKVETLPIEKAAKGGTRLFLLESADQILFQKRIFGALQAIMMKSRWSRYQHATTGINPYVEFKTFYQRLRATGEKGFDADYERFDKRMPPWVQRVFQRVMEIMFLWVGIAKSALEAHHLARAATRSLYEKYYLFEGVLYYCAFDWSSGNELTNPGGSIQNDFLVLNAVDGCWERHATETEKKEWGAYLTVEAIHDFLCWYTHGDDLTATVHHLVEHIFNYENFAEVMAEAGMIFTPAHKLEKSYKLKAMETLSFIGREFEFDESALTTPHGRLRFSAMSGMLHWTELPTRAQTFSVLDSFAIEARAYPKASYDAFVETISEALARKHWAYTFPSWEDARMGLRMDQNGGYVSVAEMDSRSILQVIEENARRVAVSNSAPLDEFRSSGNRLKTPKGEAGGLRKASVRAKQSNTSSLPLAGGLKVTSDSPSAGRDVRSRTLVKSGEKQRESSVKTVEYQTSIKSTRMQVDYLCEKLLEIFPEGKLALSSRHCTIPGGSRGLSVKAQINMDTSEINKQSELIKAAVEYMGKVLLGRDIYEIDWNTARDILRLKKDKRDASFFWKGEHITAAGAEGFCMTKDFVPHMPKGMWRTWCCAACGARPIGFIALLDHVKNSHTHFTTTNVFPLPEEIKYGKPNTTPGSKGVQNQTKLTSSFKPKTHWARGEPQPSAPSECQMERPLADQGVVGATGAVADAVGGVSTSLASIAASQASTAGMTPAENPSGILTGTTVPSSEAIVMRTAGIPPGIGASTGVQWNVQDQAIGAYEVIYDGNISTSAHPAGTVIFDLPLYEFGANANKYISGHYYQEGPTEYQVEFTGTTNTAGSFIVYDEERSTEPISISRALSRPHVVFNASNGFTQKPFLLEDVLETLRSRKVTGEDPTTYPRLRAIMYVPLVNTYASDLTLNLKVLSRPGIGYRCWSPVGTQLNQRADYIALPKPNFINIDSNRRVDLIPFDEDLSETPAFERYRRQGAIPMPRGNATAGAVGSGIFPNTEGEKTGFLRSLAQNANAQQVFMLACSAVETGIETSLSAPDLMLKETDGNAMAWTTDATIKLKYNNATGYVGKPGHIIGSPTDSRVYAAGSGQEYMKFATYIFANSEDGRAAFQAATNEDARDRAEAALAQTDPYPGAEQRAIFASSFIQPEIPTGTTAQFACPDSANTDWAAAIEAWMALGTREDQLGQLIVDGKYIGDVKIEVGSGGYYISCKCEARYLELEPKKSVTIGNLRKAGNLQPNAMNTNLWNSRQSTRKSDPEQREFWRLLLQTATQRLRKERKRTRAVRGIVPDSDMSVCEAALAAGGALSGLGGALGQWGQNQFWGKEFEANRKHEMEQLAMQLGLQKGMQEMQLKADHRANTGAMLMNMSKNGMSLKRTPLKLNVTDQGPGTKEVPARKGETPMQTHLRAAGRTQPTPSTLQVKNGESVPDALKRTNTTGLKEQSQAFKTRNPGAKDVAPTHAPNIQQPQGYQPPMGNTTSGGMEQYHPASIMAGAKINPSDVLSAQAPYTESMKRL